MRALLAALILCAMVLPRVAHAELATYYGGHDGYCNKRTASGERYDCNGMTAAMLHMPLGARVRVCGPAGCATLRINDRGPYANGATIDLSMAAARIICGGLRSCHVSIQVLGRAAF